MKTILKTAVLLAVTITLFSCGSDDDGQKNTKLRLIDYTRNSNENIFTYDTQGKLSSYKFGSGALVNLLYDSNDRLIQKGDETYTYNSQGKINKIIYRSYTKNVIYNPQGKIAALEFSGEPLTKMAYDTSNKLLSVTESVTEDDKIKNTLIYDSNNNVIQVIGEKSSDRGTTYTPWRVSNFTYDTKKNPYYDVIKSIGVTEPLTVIDIIPSLPITIISGGRTAERVFFYSPNNLLTSSIQDIFDVSIETEYVYNDNDYPTAAEKSIHRINRTTGTVSEYTYFYNWNYEEY